jgi:hypothetical protein
MLNTLRLAVDSIRPLSRVDYNPVFAGDRTAKSIAGPFNPVKFPGRTAHNFTVGVGIVIH